MSSHFEGFYQKHYRADNDPYDFQDNLDLVGEETKHPIIWFFLGSFVLILFPLAITLLYYFGPNLSTLFHAEEHQSLSVKTISLKVGEASFLVPGNYLRFSHLRRGGHVKNLDIYFRWPELTGFDKKKEDDFINRSMNSSIVNISISSPERIWSAQKRLEDIYPVYFNGEASKVAFGLMHRTLNAKSGYDTDDIFYARGKNSLFLVHCRKEISPLAPSDCYRDLILPGNALLQYRFRRSKLKYWRQIDKDVLKLVKQFQK